jgi:hypothetical protein
LLDLPRIFGTTLATIPLDIPYLSIDGKLLEKWGDRIGAGHGALRVGLVWAGNPRHESDHQRSVSFDLFSALSCLTGVEFFSLQKGNAATEAANSPAGMRLIDLSGEFDDFADTAALIANLDMIVSVDTAVAHLAGAIGKPVWTLLPFFSEWRWMLDRDDSPWYPAMRLFRQPHDGGWEETIAMLVEEMRKIAADSADRS